MPFSNEQSRGTTHVRGKDIDQAFMYVINEAKREIKIMTLGGDELPLLRPPLKAAAERGVSIKFLLCVDLNDPAADKCRRLYNTFRNVGEVRHLNPSQYPHAGGDADQKTGGWMIVDSAVELVWSSRLLN